jgi:hypothetical protein
VAEARERTLGEEGVNRYSEVGRRREALQLRERVVALVSTSPSYPSR